MCVTAHRQHASTGASGTEYQRANLLKILQPHPCVMRTSILQTVGQSLRKVRPKASDQIAPVEKLKKQKKKQKGESKMAQPLLVHKNTSDYNLPNKKARKS